MKKLHYDRAIKFYNDLYEYEIQKGTKEKLTQVKLAELIKSNRVTLNNYKNGVSIKFDEIADLVEGITGYPQSKFIEKL